MITIQGTEEEIVEFFKNNMHILENQECRFKEGQLYFPAHLGNIKVQFNAVDKTSAFWEKRPFFLAWMRVSKNETGPCIEGEYLKVKLTKKKTDRIKQLMRFFKTANKGKL
jgi:hypothetical protein